MVLDELELEVADASGSTRIRANSLKEANQNGHRMEKYGVTIANRYSCRKLATASSPHAEKMDVFNMIAAVELRSLTSPRLVISTSVPTSEIYKADALQTAHLYSFLEH